MPIFSLDRLQIVHSDRDFNYRVAAKTFESEWRPSIPLLSNHTRYPSCSISMKERPIVVTPTAIMTMEEQ